MSVLSIPFLTASIAGEVIRTAAEISTNQVTIGEARVFAIQNRRGIVETLSRGLVTALLDGPVPTYDRKTISCRGTQ